MTKKFKKIIINMNQKADRVIVCLLSIKNLKFYNHIKGYDYGDVILETAYDKVQRCIDGCGEVYQFGSKLLLILRHKINSKKDVKVIIEKVIDVFSKPIDLQQENLRIEIHIGISIYPNDSEELYEVLKYAEIALTYAKYESIYRYKFFEYEMYQNIIKKAKIEADILNAVYNNEFILYYQPQVDINTMKIYAMEALLRWKHPEYGILPPSYFIDIVEQNGLINEIGKFVFEEACREIKRCHGLGYNNLYVSINISPKQLGDDSFLTFIEEILKKTQVDPKYINIEITERILIKPSESIVNLLIALRRKGIKIYIDDFGTKYSSLNYLYCLPLDGIKIEKSFVDRIQDFQKEFIITRNIVKLAHELNLEVVAEGVERSEQLETLRIINCNKIQGFIFSKPISSNDFVHLLNKFNK